MKDLEQYLRDNAPSTPDEGQFLIETNARLSAVEGIKETVDRENRRWRLALIVALAAGLALGCIVTLLVLFVPVQPVHADSSVFLKALEKLQGCKEVLFGLIALMAVALGLVSMTKRREVL